MIFSDCFIDGREILDEDYHYRRLRLRPEKLIGYSINDSFRFKEMLAAELKVKASRVDGTFVGEHGST